MSIARKYVISTFLVVFLLGSVFYPMEAYLSYRAEMQRMTRQLQQIRNSHIPFLVSSLWLTNHQLLQQQLDSIVLFPYIHRVEVVNDEGTLFYAGAEAGADLAPHREELTYDFRGEQVDVGTLTIYVNETQLAMDVWAQEISFLAFQVLSAVVLALFISLMFHSMVGRHLRRFADYLRTDPEGTMAEPFSLHRRGGTNDELEYLIQSFNTMRSRLRRHLEQREVLLREVHHRIKNNMLTVESLLSLQEQSIDNPQARVALSEARSRLQSMGVLYDRLYRSGSARAMSAEKYLESLIDEIVRVYPSSASVHTEADIEAVVLDVRVLSSLGIIVNELLTNALKHAFPNGGEGSVRLELGQVDTDEVELRYRDDGVGMTDAAASGASGGLGMVLVQTLTDQLGGTLEVRAEAGTMVLIRFPV